MVIEQHYKLMPAAVLARRSEIGMVLRLRVCNEGTQNELL